MGLFKKKKIAESVVRKSKRSPTNDLNRLLGSPVSPYSATASGSKSSPIMATVSKRNKFFFGNGGVGGTNHHSINNNKKQAAAETTTKFQRLSEVMDSPSVVVVPRGGGDGGGGSGGVGHLSPLPSPTKISRGVGILAPVPSPPPPMEIVCNQVSNDEDDQITEDLRTFDEGFHTTQTSSSLSSSSTGDSNKRQSHRNKNNNSRRSARKSIFPSLGNSNKPSSASGKFVPLDEEQEYQPPSGFFDLKASNKSSQSTSSKKQQLIKEDEPEEAEEQLIDSNTQNVTKKATRKNRSRRSSLEASLHVLQQHQSKPRAHLPFQPMTDDEEEADQGTLSSNSLVKAIRRQTLSKPAAYQPSHFGTIQSKLSEDSFDVHTDVNFGPNSFPKDAALGIHEEKEEEEPEEVPVPPSNYVGLSYSATNGDEVDGTTSNTTFVEDKTPVKSHSHSTDDSSTKCADGDSAEFRQFVFDENFTRIETVSVERSDSGAGTTAFASAAAMFLKNNASSANKGSSYPSPLRASGKSAIISPGLSRAQQPKRICGSFSNKNGFQIKMKDPMPTSDMMPIKTLRRSKRDSQDPLAFDANEATRFKPVSEPTQPMKTSQPSPTDTQASTSFADFGIDSSERKKMDLSGEFESLDVTDFNNKKTKFPSLDKMLSSGQKDKKVTEDSDFTVISQTSYTIGQKSSASTIGYLSFHSNPSTLAKNLHARDSSKKEVNFNKKVSHIPENDEDPFKIGDFAANDGKKHADDANGTLWQSDMDPFATLRIKDNDESKSETETETESFGHFDDTLIMSIRHNASKREEHSVSRPDPSPKNTPAPNSKKSRDASGKKESPNKKCVENEVDDDRQAGKSHRRFSIDENARPSDTDENHGGMFRSQYDFSTPSKGITMEKNLSASKQTTSSQGITLEKILTGSNNATDGRALSLPGSGFSLDNNFSSSFEKGILSPAKDDSNRLKTDKNQDLFPLQDAFPLVRSSNQRLDHGSNKSTSSGPSAVPHDAILGSMLFRWTHSESTMSVPAKDAPVRPAEPASPSVAREKLPCVVDTSDSDMGASTVSSVTEDASSFYEKSFPQWNKRAHDVLNHYHNHHNYKVRGNQANQKAHYNSVYRSQHTKVAPNGQRPQFSS